MTIDEQYVVRHCGTCGQRIEAHLTPIPGCTGNFVSYQHTCPTTYLLVQGYWWAPRP